MAAQAMAAARLTPASLWRGVTGCEIGDELLEWPPDLLALTDVLLDRSESYRFALSPPDGARWPPVRMPAWPDAVVDAGRQLSAAVEDASRPIPDLLAAEWEVFREAVELPLERLARALDWRLCEALLTLHAIADEACAGLAIALDTTAGDGSLYRARGRELLARTGSLSRIPPEYLRVLPKVLTPPNGTSLRSLSRYASVHGPGVETRWHKVRGRRPGRRSYDMAVNYLLLPWPLRVRESDFRPLPETVQHTGRGSFGFFEFVPAESLDLDLVDRMIVAARDEARRVHLVVLPESAVDASEIEALEELLEWHGVIALIAGVRQAAQGPGQFPSNWVHIGVSNGEQWVHLRQSKHHRWSLDEEQVYQYHLGGALHPHIRWWEAMEIPRRSLYFVEAGGATLAAVVCEDLAQIDDVANVLRSVGPTIVVTPLLDGPQLSSRWTARYASVLADDPGSAVLTLTSFGMVQRSRPRGQEVSPIVALWKDPGRGIREIPLAKDAQGVLISTSTDRAARRTTDGRTPVENGSEVFDMSVYQVRAAGTGSNPPAPRSEPPTQPGLDAEELTILASWAEAFAEALATTPDRIEAMLADADPGAAWRAEIGIVEPSALLGEAIGEMTRSVRSAIVAGPDSPHDAVLRDLRGDCGEPGINRLVRRALRSALEQRHARRASAIAVQRRASAKP